MKSGIRNREGEPMKIIKWLFGGAAFIVLFGLGLEFFRIKLGFHIDAPQTLRVIAGYLFLSETYPYREDSK